MYLPLEQTTIISSRKANVKNNLTLFDFRLSPHLDLCFYKDEYREQYKGRQNKVPYIEGTH